MSSSKVVFAMCYCIPYHTENKLLVLEWPTFTDVCSLTVPYNRNFSVRKIQGKQRKKNCIRFHLATILLVFYSMGVGGVTGHKAVLFLCEKM